MCTAAAYRTDGLYFGRNLDYEMSYGEQIAVIPRNYPLISECSAAIADITQ